MRHACEERLPGSNRRRWSSSRAEAWMRPRARAKTAASRSLSESLNQRRMPSRWMGAALASSSSPSAVIAAVTLRRSSFDRSRRTNPARSMRSTRRLTPGWERVTNSLSSDMASRSQACDARQVSLAMANCRCDSSMS